MDNLEQVDPQRLYDWLWAMSEALFHEVADAPPEPSGVTPLSRRRLWHNLDMVIEEVIRRWWNCIETRERSRLR